VKLLLRGVVGLGVLALGSWPSPARAEATLVKPADNWEVYVTGRVSAFAEIIEGHGVPQPRDPNHAVSQEGVPFDADSSDGTSNKSGHGLAFRVRSGFLGNILALGVRSQITPNTTVSGKIAIWSTIESQGQRNYKPNTPDVREGYVKVDGPLGAVLGGRALSLFGRGATEIDFLYGHGYGVGAPQGFNDIGPTAGHIGFGVLANIFAAGIVYSTPKFAGLQLNVGYYDPAVLVGQRYARVKLGRPEAQATYDVSFTEDARLHAFVEGAFQKLYDTNGTNDSKNVYGAQAGFRGELGAFHLGVAVFAGTGLGINYFLSQTDSINNQTSNNMRPFDGAYVQAQVSVRKFDFNAGVGITRAHQMTDDLDLSLSPSQTDYLKQQRGISGVVVYHFASYLHGALDYFRADTNWWGGEHQGVNSFNVGLTATF
jgi:hypothetical protein